MQIKFFKLKKEKNFKKKSSEIRPYFYWSLIFYMGLGLTLLAFAFGFYFFRQINKEYVSANSTKGQETVKRERIQKVLEYFSLREEKSQKILNSPAPVIDPSL